MKKIHIFSTIFLLILVFFVTPNNKITHSAPIFFKSILDQEYPSQDISNTVSVAKPKLVGEKENLEISAASYLVIDQDTLSPILSKNASQKLYIGSLTKLMTVIVALENAGLDDIVEIKNNFENISSYRMGLSAGEKITLENLIYGSLISSANDAAEAIALHIGNGDYNKFIDMMNKKAAEIGMKNTHFSNAMGLDNSGNYSTSQDLAYLANYALKNSFINESVKIKEKKVFSEDGRLAHNLLNTNELLFDEKLKIFGLKTGKTPWAGECLIALSENDSGNKILSLVLGSEARFEDTKKLISWVWDNIVWE